MELAGKLIIEIAELDALTGPSNSASKGFLTRRFDEFRPPYGKHTINQPRQCIFAGTINPPIGGYLTDPTGARRIWPVTCVGMVDRDGVERDRDQLWAEAVVRYKAGDPWWLETPELEALATAEQAARFKTRSLARADRKMARRQRKEVGVAEVLKQRTWHRPDRCEPLGRNAGRRASSRIWASPGAGRTEGRRPSPVDIGANKSKSLTRRYGPWRFAGRYLWPPISRKEENT